MAVQEEYGKIRGRVDQIALLAKVELNADTFSIEEKSVPRKISSPLDSVRFYSAFLRNDLFATDDLFQWFE